MKFKHFNSLFLSSLILFVFGVTNFYWYQKFDSLIPIKEAKLEQLQSKIHLVNCKAINNDALLSIAQGSVEDNQSIAEIFFYEGWIFVFIGVVNLAIVISYRRAQNKNLTV